MGHVQRIFTVKIHKNLREEFEEKFESTALKSLEGAKGLIEAKILRPSSPLGVNYSLISIWSDEAAIINFFGDKWHSPVIASEMEKFAIKASVHHFTDWD